MKGRQKEELGRMKCPAGPSEPGALLRYLARAQHTPPCRAAAFAKRYGPPSPSPEGNQGSIGLGPLDEEGWRAATGCVDEHNVVVLIDAQGWRIRTQILQVLVRITVH